MINDASSYYSGDRTILQCDVSLPHVMHNTASDDVFLVSSAKRLLASLILLEDAAVEFYSLIANRFRPFDTVIHSILHEISANKSQYKIRLEALFNANYGYDVCAENADATIAVQPQLTWNDHFFVINQTMADDLLWAIVDMQIKTYELYKTAYINAPVGSLSVCYQEMLELTQEQLLILQEQLERLEMLSFVDDDGSIAGREFVKHQVMQVPRQLDGVATEPALEYARPVAGAAIGDAVSESFFLFHVDSNA